MPRIRDFAYALKLKLIELPPDELRIEINSLREQRQTAVTTMLAKAANKTKGKRGSTLKIEGSKISWKSERAPRKTKDPNAPRKTREKRVKIDPLQVVRELGFEISDEVAAIISGASRKRKRKTKDPQVPQEQK